MVFLSKQQFQVVSHLPCTVLHPWTSSCIKNYVSTSLLGLKGGSKFFLLIYVIQILLRRDYQLSTLIQTGKIFLRSCLFCGFCAGSSIGTMCFLRWLNGKHKILSLGFIPGMVGGCGVFFEHSSRRGIDFTIFIALVANLYLKLFQVEGILNLTLPIELLIFTTSSSLLLYCLRKYNSSRSILWYSNVAANLVSNVIAIWLVIVQRLSINLEDRNQCSHKEPCLKSIQKAGSSYFCYALVLQVVKVMLYNIDKLFKTPMSFLKIIFDPQMFRLPLFAGVYVTLLQGVNCLLVKYREQDEAWHSLPAGIVASLSYLIQPNLSLALIAFSNLIQIVCREFTKDFKLPSWPWQELLCIILMGLLFHARAAYPLLFPRYMAYIMDTATAGRATDVYRLVEENLMVRNYVT